MKKFILLILTIILILCIASCSKATAEETASSYLFTRTNYIIDSGVMASIVVDHETGVNYIFYKAGYGGGLSPRYNADGSLYVSEESE